MKLKTLFAAVALLAATACDNGPTSTPLERIGPPPALPAGAQTVTLGSGLQYAEISVGAGTVADVNDRVQVHYTGWLQSTQTAFDSSRDRQPISFTLGAHSVIPGFEEGIVGMRVGGTRRLIVPPALGYGSEDVRSPTTGRVVIPAGSTLIFDVQLVAITG